MNRFTKLLGGGDLRSLSDSNKAVTLIHDQKSFDELFLNLLSSDRKIVMRAADAVEKVTVHHPEYLSKHKKTVIELCRNAVNMELKWHMAVLVSRISLNKKESGITWQVLYNWARDQKESRLVRVHSIQGMFNMLKQHNELNKDFYLLLSEIERENIPSINARIRKLNKLNII